MLLLGFGWLLFLWIALALFSGARPSAQIFNPEALTVAAGYAVCCFGLTGLLLTLMGPLPRLNALAVILLHQTVAFLPAQPILLVVGLNYARQGADIFVQFEPYTWPWFQFWLRGWMIASPSYLVWGVAPTLVFSALFLRERRADLRRD